MTTDEFKGGIVDPFTGEDIETNTVLPYADITDPQTLNKYGYVRNNPLRYTDPDGHCTDGLTCALEGAVIGSEAGPIGTGIGAGVGLLVGIFGGAVVDTAVTNPGMFDHYATDGVIPNSYWNEDTNGSKPGTLGKPDHQQTVQEEAQKMGGTTEVKVETPGGEKGSRRIDAGKVENGKVTQATQVIRPNKNGTPPAREVRAARDIKKATGVEPKLVPVRPEKPKSKDD